MATERQIQANRANAKRSTGPVTEKGKQASSQNALRHGQLSSCVVLKAEAAPFFDDLMDSLIEEFQPRTANETALIETMAVARWKLYRNWTLHTALLELETVKQDHSVGNAPVITALAFKSLADSSHSLQLLHRYETSLDRQYSRALNNLLKVRATRIAPPDMPIETVAEASQSEPNQEFPKEPNLPPQSPLPKHPEKTAKHPESVKPAQNLVAIPQRRPVSTAVTQNRTVLAPRTVHSTPPKTK
jgi:hypothetical protein